MLYKILYEQGFACDDKDTHFELVTGYVYTAPDDMLDSRPGTLMLTDCIELCRRNSTCKSANFETGLCVLFGSSAADFPGKKDLQLSLKSWLYSRFFLCMYFQIRYPVGFGMFQPTLTLFHYSIKLKGITFRGFPVGISTLKYIVPK